MKIQDLIRAALRKAAKKKLQEVRDANIEGVEPFDPKKLQDEQPDDKPK